MTENSADGKEVVVLGADEVEARQGSDPRRDEIEELRASRTRLVLAADADRRRIERALHDGVQQLLVTMATDLELAIATVDADPAGARALFDDLRRDVQEALRATRELAEMVLPPLLEAGGLRVAVRSAAAARDIPVTLDVPSNMGGAPQIAGSVYACCLDVFELVGTGTSVACTVRQDADTVTFEIVASRVIDPGASVRDRVEALGGQLTIRHEDHRTTVIGSLPRTG